MKILVVEDNPQHMLDAETAAEVAGVEIVTSLCADDGIAQMDASITGVITDIYLPLQQDGRYSDANTPTGLLVAAEAAKAGIPFVLCTAGYHHGIKYEWITQMTEALGWHVIESGAWDKPQEEAPTKDWKRAFEAVLRQIP